VEGLKRKRDSVLAELKDLAKHRRKEPELQNLKSQIDGLEHRLRYSTKDKETTVRDHFQLYDFLIKIQSLHPLAIPQSTVVHSRLFNYLACMLPELNNDY